MDKNNKSNDFRKENELTDKDIDNINAPNSIDDKENELKNSNDSEKEAYLGDLFAEDEGDVEEINNKPDYTDQNLDYEASNLEYSSRGSKRRGSRRKSYRKKGKSGLLIKILIGIIILLMLAFLAIFAMYKSGLKAASPDSEESVRINIAKGDTPTLLASKLYEKGAIKSEKWAKVYIKLNKVSEIKAGRYKIPKSKTVPEIYEMFKNGEVNNEEVTITLVEGKTFKDLAAVIESKTNHSAEDVINLGKDKEYLKELSDKYWFVDYDKITNSDIYYPLEGYLFPDTYIIENKDSSIKTIFKLMLDETAKKLNTFENAAKKQLNSHELLTLASISELEARNPEGRKLVATIFANRLVKKMSLGSDVTTYYAEQIKMSDRDLTMRELNSENAYNTRGPNMEGKLPVGPICMPSESSINAAIMIATDYEPTEELYFVADKNGKIYTAKNYNEHNRIINDLKNRNLWYEYK